LNYSDIPAAMRLKEAAGWNQTEEDWRRLLALAPDSCFGIECEGTLAATVTAICYSGELGWIGMVLTASEFRHRGFARALMRHTLDHLRSRGISWVKLDATDMGARIYADFDFRFEFYVERWFRPAEASPLPRNEVCEQPLEIAPIEALDVFGISRARLLDALLRSCGGTFLDRAGFAMWRPGSFAHHFGPCVAFDARSAERLLRCALHANAGRPLVWDLAPENAAALRLAAQYGFQHSRTLSRMACALDPGAQPVHPKMNSIFALAGFEYG
jgi:GNAT superfamily N-acetyltransferase